MEQVLESLSGFFSAPAEGAAGAFALYMFYFSRFMLPVAAIAVISRCARSMLRERYEPEVWAYVDLPNGARAPLRSWECTVGRSSSCDVRLRYPGIANPHLVFIRDEWGNWRAYDLVASDAAINGQPIGSGGLDLRDSDEITVCGRQLRFFNLDKEERKIIAGRRTAPGKIISPAAMFGYLTVFQIILMFQTLYSAAEEHRAGIGFAFAALICVTWLYYIIMGIMGRKGLEVEALAFFMSSIGLTVAAVCEPQAMLKQMILLLAGVAAFIALGAWLRELDRVKRFRLLAVIAAGVLLAVNIVLGEERFGAKNWIAIGGITVQPSEFIKLAYIYAGAATLDRLYLKRNLILFIGFSAACVGALALMGDFGTALVFFGTFLVISFLRSGNLATIFLALTGAGLAGFLAVSVKPYIAQRFALWGHAWTDVNGSGFQQTRGMSAVASGGLFGTGAGKGWLRSIVASETDLVFELVCEELGVITAICAVLALIVMAVFVVRNAAQARSSFYVITGVGAISMMLIQAGLNIFGSLDMLPFTGVTLPFLSMGGSSLISCWAMLAFIKATDTRKDSSFVVKSPTGMQDKNEFAQEGVYEAPEEVPEEELGNDVGAAGRNLFDRRGERGW